MAIILRGNKGAALTHTELDNNFREFFYSASVNDSEIRLYRSRSLDAFESIKFTSPNGQNYFIQIKSGSGLSGSSAVFTGSNNFTYDFDNSIFTVTGSSNFLGSLTVDGTITATQLQIVTSSVIYESGSTVFGDSDNDIHRFTGSLRVSNGITGSLDFSNLDSVPIFISGAGQIASEISGSITAFSSSAVDRIEALEAYTASLDATYATDAELNAATASLSSSIATSISNTSQSLATTIQNVSSSAASTYLKRTSDTLTGSLTVTSNLVVGGTITAQEFHTEFLSASIVYESGSTKFGDTSDDVHSFTGSVRVLGPLAIYGINDVSESIARAIESGSQVQVTNNVNNRILTATGGNALNAESNLTFDGDILDINGTQIKRLTPADTGLVGLIGGTPSGSLIETLDGGHFVIGLRDDAASDSFVVVSGQGNYYYDSTYDKVAIRVSGSGDTYVGGTFTAANDSTINGNLTVTGNITAGSNITAYFSSDERLKENIIPIGNAIDKINQIGGYEFDWNNNSELSGHDVGVIAQEIEKVLPEIVATREDGYKAVRYEKIVALLIQAVKEQQLQIEELKSKL